MIPSTRFVLSLALLFALTAPAAMAQPQPDPTTPASETTDPSAYPLQPTSPPPEIPIADAIQRVTDANLMSGYPDGQFHPERGVNRAELATILVKTFQLKSREPNLKIQDIQLTDVPPTYWAYPAIQQVLRTDIMEGYHKNDRFYPNQQVTRAEGFAIFAQAYGVFQFEPNTIAQIMAPYADASQIPAWAHKAMATSLHEGFVNTKLIPPPQNAPLPNQLISPNTPLTRGDLALALTQYLNRQNGIPYGQQP